MAAPTTGRVIHFVDEKGKHWPAIVTTGNEDGTADLVVIFTGKPNEPHLGAHARVKQAEPTADAPAPAWTWHYPEGSPTAPGATNGPAALSAVVRNELAALRANNNDLAARVKALEDRNAQADESAKRMRESLERLTAPTIESAVGGSKDPILELRNAPEAIV